MPIHYDTRLDRTFHALGDGTRRAMLSLLAAQGECSASQLGEPFRISQPSASQHLRVLEHAGLIQRRVRGRVHLFRIAEGPLTEAGTWLDRHRKLWSRSLTKLDAVVESIRKGRG